MSVFSGIDYIQKRGITLGGRIVLRNPVINRVAAAINVTGTILANQLAGGLITSTSAAAVTATLPTASLLATEVKASRGTSVDFVVDNTAGANTVTVAVGTGIVTASAVLTGANTLTVASGAIGVFKIVFSSTTAALLYRVG